MTKKALFLATELDTDWHGFLSGLEIRDWLFENYHPLCSLRSLSGCHPSPILNSRYRIIEGVYKRPSFLKTEFAPPSRSFRSILP